MVDLYGEAKAKGLSPNRGVELLPFIEGMLRTGRRDLAEPLAAAVRAQYGALAQLEAVLAQAGAAPAAPPGPEATPKDPAAR